MTFKEALASAGYGKLDPGAWAETLVVDKAPEVPVNADGRLWLHTGGPALASWGMVARSSSGQPYRTNQSLSVYIAQVRGDHASARSDSRLVLKIGWS
ncbi:MAG: hypothetical protein CMK74_12345 [Pseudomonadales bacterium]|nr:hypothetical protein [Pseudomonadales bacterium]